MQEPTEKATHFIRNIIQEDLKSGKIKQVVTRFPPEPNGYLHLGHAKSINLNFSMALENGGRCHLRMDDSNPETEDMEYVEAIKRDVQWLGFDWGQHLYYASDYYDQLYQWAIDLIKQGKAYVCDLNAEQMREYRGTLTSPGKDSPGRSRSVEENLKLFEDMRTGKYQEGQYTLRAKIDMSSGNINMRDPVLYRIRYTTHYRTGDKWCIYPLYDFTHGYSDSLEGITHSICTLEFEDHRPLYDWFLDNVKTPCHPQQIEFSRLNLSYVMMSKRYLKALVEDKLVDGWDDPRMPTIAGIRRRGYTPNGIRKFCEMIGVSKKDTVIDFGILEECIRDDLNEVAPRAMCVLKPLKLVIENFPEDKVIEVDAKNHPLKPEMGTRKLPFSREIYIEQDDFMENPPKDYHRLFPGGEVRLRYSYIVKVEKAIKDPKTGEIIELRGTIDPDTLGKNPVGRKVKGIIHWLSAQHSLPAEVRLYDRLFQVEAPGGENFRTQLNPDSMQIVSSAKVESSLKNAKPEIGYQFERLGYFCADLKNSKPNQLVFNRTVTLKDTWSKDSK